MQRSRGDFSAVELFELFFDEAVVELLVEQTRKYALFLNMPDPEVTTEEMRCFIGVLVLSGYTRLPGKKCYWDSGTDMRNTMVYNAMRRNRFIQIMRFLHCADNASLTLSDKLTKLRPLMTLLKARFLKHFQPVRHLSYDESMIEYYGRHGCKQFIRGKPIRFGYKVWCLNAKNGYLVNFEVYQGKQGNPGRSAKYEKDFGKAAAPLLQMVDELPAEAHHLPFFFYFDNLFTSIPLLRHLKGQGYEGTGTVRQNRVPKECPIARPDFVKRQPRGHEEHVLSDDGIIVVLWMDNSVVTIASTIHGVEPVSSAESAGTCSGRPPHRYPRGGGRSLGADYLQHLGGLRFLAAVASMAQVSKMLARGCLLIAGKEVPLEQMGVPVVHMTVYRLPPCVSNANLVAAFALYGKVRLVTETAFLSRNSIGNRTRLVWLEMTKSPPNFLTVAGTRAIIEYRGMRRVCSRCGGEGHFDAACKQVRPSAYYRAIEGFKRALDADLPEVDLSDTAPMAISQQIACVRLSEDEARRTATSE
ncbi:hypothetical protein V5799_022020 [Amblyomma americanum]|uniref:PiggyBac transposable element-derived protein domain-containing protein n=1 Tax=Amblyomma americanum TaxID=6943 RepID=A0AAQ4FN78_AMBAM